MAGAGEAPVTVAGNVYVALRAHLADTRCRTFITDMKLRVGAVDAYFYPDAMVTCAAAAADAADPMVEHEPTLIVEVLSPGTAADDHGDTDSAGRRSARPLTERAARDRCGLRRRSS